MWIAVAAVIALFAATEPARRLEAETGLVWNYLMRGPVAPPQGAVVVALDEASLDRLRSEARVNGFGTGVWANCLAPEDIFEMREIRSATTLPRGLFACIAQRLSELKPAAIAFDVRFLVPRRGDAVFAEAIRSSPPVFLVDEMGRASADGVARRRPVASIASVARATAPFLVEARPGAPTTLYLGRTAGPNEVVESLPCVLLRAQLARDCPVGEAQAFLMYGAAGTVPSVALRDLFERPDEVAEALRGVVAFVGASSPGDASKLDHFPIPAFGMVAGVELAATAYLNLVERRVPATPPGWSRFAIALALAAPIIASATLFRGSFGPALLLLTTAASFAAGYAIFLADIRTPTAVPTLLAAAAGVGLWLGVRGALGRRLVMALAPRPVAERLLSGAGAGAGSENVTAVFIDLEGSTGLAERLGPARFADLIGKYYDIVGQEVDRNGGHIEDFRGDGVLAIFSNAKTRDHAVRACAALSTLAEALRRSDDDSIVELRLRAGAATGEVRTGVFLAGSRLSVATLGDTVNSAARIEELGKRLRGETTRAAPVLALVDDETRRQSGLSPGATTPFDTLTLRGRSAPTIIHRLLLG